MTRLAENLDYIKNQNLELEKKIIILDKKINQLDIKPINLDKRINKQEQDINTCLKRLAELKQLAVE